ncbi:MAG: T9SS type A sorting domain-containing protein [Candidatus Stahlbacteria bacterium]|nr:T9SS type A sorting domain-containing protein [Candidatus Stahlbacteria bacterium]
MSRYKSSFVMGAILILFAGIADGSRWSRTGPVNYGRSGTSSAVLTNGKVMIMGGFELGAEKRYEIFDPFTGKWSVDTLPQNRELLHDMAILLPNGKVLAVGDYNDNVKGLLYDAFTNTWAISALTFPISGVWWSDRPCATLLKDRRVLIAVAFSSFSYGKRCFIYDYTSDIVTETDSLESQYHIDGAVEVLLPDGKVLLAGGGARYDTDRGIKACEIYNPVTNKWSFTDSMSLRRGRFSGVLLRPPWQRVLVAGGNLEYTGVTEEYDPGSGVWNNSNGTLIGMDTLRETSSMILLPNGKPILIGGSQMSGTGFPYCSTCVIYDPNTKTWSPTDTMLQYTRGHYISTILHTGKVLAAAGFTMAYHETTACEIYDPSEPYSINRTSLIVNRKYHTTTPLPIIHSSICSTTVLIVGGENSVGPIKDCELYNYDLDEIMITGPLSVGRTKHTAILLASPSHLVLAAGGKNSAGVAIKSCELYDVIPETWNFTLGEMSVARFNHSATLLKDGRVLVTGGQPSDVAYTNTCEIYSPTSNTWTNTGPMATARAFHSAVLLFNGKVLAIGGENSSGAISSCEIWDPGTGNWTPVNSLSTARSLHTATLLACGRVFVIGGKGAGGVILGSCEIYDPATGNWGPEGSLKGARYGHNTILTYSGLVLVLGGYTGSYAVYSEIWDPAAEIDTLTGLHQWKSANQLNVGRAYHSSVIVPGLRPWVLIFGGESSSGAINSIERWEPGLGYMPTWQSTITNFKSITPISTMMHVEGTLFREYSEADGGNHCHIASSDHPIMTLRRIGGGNWQSNGGGEFMYMPLSNDWDAGQTNILLPDHAEGWYRIWAIVNGIPTKWYEPCVEVEEGKANRIIKPSVFPTPSMGSVMFKMGNAEGKSTITIYDCTGRIVRTITSNPGIKEVKVSGLKAGIYFYRIENTISTGKGKFVVL